MSEFEVLSLCHSIHPIYWGMNHDTVILVYNLLFKKFSIFTGRDDQSFNFDLFLFSAHGIECYICTGQEHNDDKCIKTVNTCLEDQSVCMTRVEWRCEFI